MHAVEGSHVIHKIDLECMVTFYKGILNKTYIYILINSLVWREICSVGYLASLSFFKNHICDFYDPFRAHCGPPLAKHALFSCCMLRPPLAWPRPPVLLGSSLIFIACVCMWFSVESLPFAALLHCATALCC